MRRLQPSTQVVVVQLLGNCKVGSRVEPLCIVVAGVHLEKHTRRSSHTLCTPDVCPSSVYYVPQQRGTCTRMVTTQGLSASCPSAAAAQVDARRNSDAQRRTNAILTVERGNSQQHDAHLQRRLVFRLDMAHYNSNCGG